MVHALKTLHEYYEAAKLDEKTFEVRKNDRDYHVGDILALNEWYESTGYTGNAVLREITYILDDPNYCKEGYVILGVKSVAEVPRGRFEIREFNR